MNEYDTLLNPETRPAANGNEYDTILQDEERRRQQETRASLYGATDTSPDAYAKALDLSKKAGLPADTVARNLPVVERDVKLNEYDALLKASPKTAEAVRDPDTAKLAHDDLGILSTLEGSITAYYDLLRAAPAGLVTSTGAAVSGIGTLNDVAARGIVRGIEGAGLEGFGDFLADIEIPWWLSPSEILKRPGQQVKGVGAAIDVPEDRQWLGTDITGATGQMAGQIASALLGGPIASAAVLIGQGADQMAERVQAAGKEGTPEGDAAITIGASVTALTEKIGLDAMLERVPPQIKNAVLRRITDIALAGGIEAAQEVVEGVLQNLTEQALINPDAEIFEGLEREALAAGGAGALTRGLLMALIPGRQVAQQQRADEASAARAEQGIESLDKLVEQAGQSKLLGRDRERFEAFITANAGEDAAVYIPAEKLNEYFQALDAPFALMDDWGIGDQLAQATARGGDVAVPMSKYLATAAEHHAALRGDLRLGIGDYTLNEAQEFNARKEEILQERFEEARAAIEDERRYAEPQERIHEDVRSQLVAAGRSLDVAEQEATVVAAFFGTMGKRAGVDPMELYEQAGLRVRGVLPESLRDKPIDLLDPIIDRVRSGKEKTDRQIFGDSLLEWIANRGGITDPGGELAALDAGEWHRGARFRRKLLRDMGADAGPGLPGVGGVDGSSANFDPDTVMLAAWEAGFFPEFTERPTTDALFEAMREEMAGRPRFNDRQVDQQALAERQGVADLAETLDRLGIDIQAATNEEIKAALRGMGDQQRQAAGAEYEQRKSDTKRGSIQFGSGETIINLFEKADLSTFLHESGHLFLDVFGKLADNPDAPQQIRDDYRALLDWMGVKATDEIGTDQHEQFARGFEAYLYEGNAPSVGLQGVFARFRSWLVNVYRSIAKLKVNVSPEVKAVMDRMLATEDEIAAAQTSNAFAPLFKEAADAGMTDKEFADYQRTGERATQAAEERLLKRAMSEIKRERTAWWKEESAKVREEVEREINGRPVYQALHWLQTGEVLDSPDTTIPHQRLSKAVLKAVYGEDITKYLPKSVPPIWTDKGGVSPYEVADMFGLSSGDELVQQLMQVQPRRKVIETETQVRMLGKHGDLLNDGSIEEEARAAVHGDERALFLHAELRALTKRGGAADPTPRSEAKRLAAQIIAREPVRRAQPGRLAQAEVRAGKAAERALAAGDIAEATKQKRRQLLNHYLFMEARRAQEEVDDGVRYLTRFTKKRTIPSIEQGYLDQIKGILERYSLDRASLRAIDKRTSLAAWVAEQEAQGLQVNVPDKLLNEAARMHYRNMPVEDFRGLVDTVRNIHHLGRLKQRLLDAQEKRDFDAVVDDLRSTILGNNDLRTEGTAYSPTLAGQAREVVERIHAEHVKPEFLFRRLDGYADEGPVWQRLFKPIADAEAAEQVKMREMVEGMEHAFRRYTRKERARWLTKRTFVPETGKSFTKAEMLSMALNWGNEQNRAALLEGLDWSEAQANAALSHLDARDWATVQDVWALVDTLWPDIAALQKDLTGVVPEKVEPAPFERRLADGTTVQLPGGYYPLKYDPSRSYAAFQRDERANSADLFESNWLRPATKQGHTKERVGSGGQAVRLDLSVIPEHITNVVHDITHRRAIMDIDRLIQNRRVREAIETTAGRQMYRQIRPWLQAIAADQRQPAAFLEKLIGRARMGATVVNMGWKVTTAIVQPLGILQTVERVGLPAALKHYGAFMGNPFTMKSKVDFVTARSVMMQNRQRTFDRDVNDQMKRLTKGGPVDNVMRSFFIMTGLMDMSVSVPSWLAAYEQGMQQHNGDEAKASAHADSVVRMTQSAGGVKDLAAIQRGGETWRMFTMFYSYFSVLYNLQAARLGQTKSAADLPQLAASAFFLWFAPAILGELVAGRGPDDDDDEDWLTWGAKEIAKYPFQTVVIVRDVVNAVVGDYGYGGSPALDAFEVTSSAIKSIASGDFDRSTAKAAVLAVGYWAALPSRQAWITGSYLYDLATGEESGFSFRDMVFARKQN